MLERNRNNYLAAFLFHLIDTGLKQTLLHIHHRGTRKHYILWVHSVTPGLPGEKLSHQPISDASWYKFLGYLKKRGVNEEVRTSMKMCCTQWPKGAAYPVWVPQQLLDVMREQLAMQLPPGELEKAVERASSGTGKAGKTGKTGNTRTGNTRTRGMTITMGRTSTTEPAETTDHPPAIST
ncbi:hypothetical protein K466DRAFT_579967 [Polyporus arcularius HHB13444]|uniref:Uncharacterized protein n=1 Tax=Polyporus arcularius HHB13444 TaxID=1314778 RepID=A0A5C3Q2E3_9APHY|nr:hypothetical protein K466DRAFT_579967 [Polyporus arcularius HHB13444]